jgi:hypothetical protein
MGGFPQQGGFPQPNQSPDENPFQPDETQNDH